MLKLASPTSLKVTLRALKLGSTLTLGECLQMDYRIASYTLKNSSDLHEGNNNFVF